MGGRASSYQSPFLCNRLPVWVQGADALSAFKAPNAALGQTEADRKLNASFPSLFPTLCCCWRGRGGHHLISMWAEHQAAAAVLGSEGERQ